jgi:hypothetical protein
LDAFTRHLLAQDGIMLLDAAQDDLARQCLLGIPFLEMRG